MMKGHKIQRSEMAEFKTTNRIMTQGNEHKKSLVKKKEPIRYNTEMNETTEFVG